MKKFYPIFGLILLTGFVQINAQSTFSEILTIFENKGCASAYCHGGDPGSGAGGLSLAGSETDIYNNLFEADPTNEVASARGYKLVDAGYPDRSTLYRKVNDGMYSHSDLLDGEGATMPIGGETLSKIERETIRQWILWGAPQNGKAYNDAYKDAMVEYHTEGGIDPTEVPEPPAAGEGFQLYLGPIFMQPEEEVEYMKKEDLHLPDDIEVTRLQNFMSDYSHHYVLYKYNGDPGSAPEGLRLLDFSETLTQSFVNIWQDNRDYRLPEGTAFFWEDNTVLDLNYHIKNYSTTAVLAADCYVNVHTQPKGTADKEMKSSLQMYFDLNIPAGAENHAESTSFTNGQQWNIWMLTSHTHQWGVDYDMYIEDENGDKGMQIYEGHHDTDYTFYTGSYDSAHPPVRYFDDFMNMPAGGKLYHDAMYTNTSASPVGFGVTTDDEMMTSIVLYTVGDDIQDNPIVNDLPQQICADAEPMEILANYESGAVGPGVYGNLFYPDRAGLGTHELLIGCCDPETTETITIEVVELPEAPVISPTVNGLGTTPGFASYQWYLNGDLIEGANGISLATTENGDYTVEVSNLAGCTIASEKFELQASGIVEALENVEWQIAPNPTSATTTLKLQSSEVQTARISVYNILGAEIANIFTGELIAGENILEVDLSNKSNGIYFLKINIEDQTAVERIIKN